MPRDAVPSGHCNSTTGQDVMRLKWKVYENKTSVPVTLTLKVNMDGKNAYELAGIMVNFTKGIGVSKHSNYDSKSNCVLYCIIQFARLESVKSCDRVEKAGK